MGDVVAMPGFSVPTPSNEPVKTVVEILREYLGKAEAGQIRAVGLAIVFHDGFSEVATETEFSAAAGQAWPLCVAAGQLNRRIERYIDQ